MSEYRNTNAPNLLATAGSVQYAYRRFGSTGGSPLLLLNYFAANLDAWDPKITDGFASYREVILLDGAGIGRSNGETPSTVGATAEGCYRFCQALGLQSFDIVGFSLGGMIAQQLAYDHPDLIRRIILLGTGPRGGEGMTFTELSTEDLVDPVKLLKSAFFTPSEASQAAAEAYLARLSLRAAELDTPVSMAAASAQLNAIRGWGLIPSTDRYAMLARIHQPTLVVHGSKDIVVPPINSFLLARNMPNAKLVLYPDANHGAQSQYAEDFLQQAQQFLGR
jgi:pimeloyl-ACP methyl ester carboxylesterase